MFGLLVAAAGACADATGPDLRSASVEVAAVDDSIRFTAVGATRSVSADARRRGNPVTAPLRWFGSNDSVATVTRDGHVVARGAGAARLYVVSDSGGVDSVLVRVTPVPARARITRARTRLVAHRSFQFNAEARDAGDGPVTSGPVTWSSSHPSLLAVDAAGLVRAIAPITARITATVNGFAAETTVTVVAPPRLRFLRDTIVLGVDHRIINEDETQFLLADDASPSDRAAITLVFGDSMVANGPLATYIPLGHWSEQRARITALRVGRSTLTASAPGWVSDTALIIVTPSRIQFSGPSPVRMFTSDYSLGPRFDLVDSTGTAREIAQRGVFRVRVSDPAVLRPISDSVVVDYASQIGAQLEPLAEGNARVVLSRDGYGADSADVRVREGTRIRVTIPQAIQGPPESGHIRTSIGHVRRRLEVRLPYSWDTIRTIRIAQRRPDVVALSDTLLPQGGIHSLVSFSTTGLSIGSDTIVVSSDGFGADTLTVEVGRPTFVAYPLPPFIRALEARPVSVQPADAGLAYPCFFSTNTSPRRLVSSDTTVLRPYPDLNWLGALHFHARGAGTASLRVESEDGLYVPLDLPPITVLPATIQLMTWPDSQPMLRVGTRALAQVQSATDGGEWSGVLPMRVRSSDTTIVRPLEDVTQVPGIFLIESGRQPGDAWIVVEGAGILPESLHVSVTPSALAVRDATPLTAGTEEPYWARLELINAVGAQQLHADSIIFDVSSSDRTVVDLVTTSLLLDRWSRSTFPISVRAIRVGTATITIRDRRTGSERFPDVVIGATVGAAPP